MAAIVRKVAHCGDMRLSQDLLECTRDRLSQLTCQCLSYLKICPIFQDSSMPCIPLLAFNFLLLEADLYTTEESPKIYGREKQNGEAGITHSASMVCLRQLVMQNADISDVMLLLRQSANTIMTTWET